MKKSKLVKKINFCRTNSESEATKGPKQWKYFFFLPSSCRGLDRVVSSVSVKSEPFYALTRGLPTPRLPCHSLHTTTQGSADKRGHTSMVPARLWPLIPFFGQSNAVRVADRVAYFGNVTVNETTLNAVTALYTYWPIYFVSIHIGLFFTLCFGTRCELTRGGGGL